jgi:hypothetical protein
MSKALMEEKKNIIPNNSLTMNKWETILQKKKNIYKQKG